jgi:hypothetical protein
MLVKIRILFSRNSSTGIEKSENKYYCIHDLNKEKGRIQNHIRIRFLPVTGSLYPVKSYPQTQRKLALTRKKYVNGSDKIKNQARRFFRSISSHLCHQKANTARETVPFSYPQMSSPILRPLSALAFRRLGAVYTRAASTRAI